MSTSDFQITRFDELVSNFVKVQKRVLQKRPISSNQNKVEEYINLLIENYNNILSYTILFNNQLSDGLKSKIHNRILRCRELLFRCFCKLNCKIKVPFGVDLFECVRREVTDVDTGSDIDTSDCDKEDLEVISGSDIKVKFGIDLANKTVYSIDNLKMASIEEKTKFISMCSNIIRENYDGNPLTLNSFIDKINLIEELQRLI